MRVCVRGGVPVCKSKLLCFGTAIVELYLLNDESTHAGMVATRRERAETSAALSHKLIL